MGAHTALLRTPSRPRLWAPLLPLGLAVFLLSGLASYHLQVRGTGVGSEGLLQGLVVLAR